MSHVARDLRDETLALARAQTPEERVVTALRLGDSDVALFAAASGLADDAARRSLAAQRARGRRASRCAARP